MRIEDYNLSVMWLWILATLVAYLVKGICGFANTPVFTSIIGFGNDNVDISPVDLLIGFIPNIVLTVKNRKYFNAKLVIPLAIIFVLGSIPGAFLLKYVSAPTIKIIFGCVIILVGVDALLTDAKILNYKIPKAIAAVIGIVSGILTGLFGIGTFLAAYVKKTTNSLEEFKANISAIFLIENVFRIIVYSFIGIITISILKRTAIIFPFMLIGLFGGMKICKFIPEKIAKFVVTIFLFVSGILMILLNI